MPCGCGGANTPGGASASSDGALLSGSLDSRFASPTPATAGSVSGDLMSLFSTPAGWIGILFFLVAAGAVAWASARKSE